MVTLFNALIIYNLIFNRTTLSTSCFRWIY